jgi:hypothetical protein
MLRSWSNERGNVGGGSELWCYYIPCTNMCSPRFNLTSVRCSATAITAWKKNLFEGTRRIMNSFRVRPDTLRPVDSLLPNHLAVLMGIRSSQVLLPRHSCTDMEERITLEVRMLSAGRRRSGCVPVV